MHKKSFYWCFSNILMIFVLCFLSYLPAYSQQNNPEKSLTILFEEFKTARKLVCGQRDEALRIGKEIIARFNDDELNKAVIEFVKKQIPIIDEQEKQCKSADSLKILYQDFKVASKSPCGQRSKAVSLGKQIFDLYNIDELNKEFLTLLQNEIWKIEKEDGICQRNALYDESYKTKQWTQFLAISKQILREEGDSPLALDIMLTFVSIGHKLTAYGKNNIYNDDVIVYAKRAIELIEEGKKTQSRWGIYESYNNRENALAWMNYIIGYISYFRLKENKKAIPYFYKATKYNNEFKYDAFVYQAVAIYYFDKEAVTASSLTINEFISRAIKISDSLADGANNLTISSAKKDELATLYRQLVKLYNTRYNLAPNENVNSLGDYIERLINRRLIDPSANVAGK